MSGAAVGSVEYGIQSHDYMKKGDRALARVTRAKAALLGVRIIGDIATSPELAIATGLGFVGAHIAYRSIRLKRHRLSTQNDVN
jgi:hypothetical protein